MSTGIERVLEQFDRHLKKATSSPPLAPVSRRLRPASPFGSPAFVVFVRSNASNVVDRTRIECEFNQSGHDGGYGSTDL